MEPETLFSICLEAGCHINSETFIQLPPFLKEKLLHKLTKRGLCTDDSFRTLIHQQLSEIDFRDCSISENSLLLLEGLNKLIILYLPEPPTVPPNAYSEAALIKVIKGKRDLLTLGMNGLQGVGDRVISALAGGSPDLLQLHIQQTSISNQALFCIGNLGSLQCLNIAKTEVNDAGIEQLASGSAGQTLIELRLDGCNRMTINGVKTLLYLMPQLDILYFHLCPNIRGLGSTLRRIESTENQAVDMDSILI